MMNSFKIKMIKLLTKKRSLIFGLIVSLILLQSVDARSPLCDQVNLKISNFCYDSKQESFSFCLREEGSKVIDIILLGQKSVYSPNPGNTQIITERCYLSEHLTKNIGSNCNVYYCKKTLRNDAVSIVLEPFVPEGFCNDEVLEITEVKECNTEDIVLPNKKETCGDGLCQNYETGRFYEIGTRKKIDWHCPEDCGYCGDGSCQDFETDFYCPKDCEDTTVNKEKTIVPIPAQPPITTNKKKYYIIGGFVGLLIILIFILNKTTKRRFKEKELKMSIGLNENKTQCQKCDWYLVKGDVFCPDCGTKVK